MIILSLSQFYHPHRPFDMLNFAPSRLLKRLSGGFRLRRFSTCQFGGPYRHNTGIASSVCFDRLPSHISKMVVSTVNRGGPKWTVDRTLFELWLGGL